MSKAPFLFALILLFSSLVGSAHANTAVAEALFEDGRRLLEEGRVDEACGKFAESQRLDPGTGTLLNLANCYEKAGRLASAWATWLEAASSARSAGQEDRQQHARAQADTLKPKLATMTLVVPAEGRVEGLIITKSGEDQASAVWGTAVPVDAGKYQIEASAPGYQGWQQEVVVVDGEASSVAIPALEADGATPAVAAVVADPTSSEEQNSRAEEPATPEEGSRDSGGSMKTWGYISAGAGVVGIVVGSIFGSKAINRNNESYDYCDEEFTNRCDQDGVDARGEAQDAALISTVFIGVGAAALVTGITLVILAPSKSSQVALSPRAGGGTLSFRGSF